MHNIYFVLRHGQSTANVAGIVLSSREEGEKIDYTLTPLGEEQVHESVAKSKETGALDLHTVIISSPFSRTRRTAEIAKEVLGTLNAFTIDDRLRERWFGDWEKTPDTAYAKVWEEDKKNPDQVSAQVESVHAVQKRVLELIDDLENEYRERKILLVSHGDVLQILLTSMQKQSPTMHREIQQLETAEIRKIEI